MRQTSRYDYARAIAGRYKRASKGEKSKLLTAFCEATGYARKYAIGILAHPPDVLARSTPRTRVRPRRYGPDELELLRLCWEITDGICGKRLAPFLGELLTILESVEAVPPSTTSETIARVSTISPATIDRVLRRVREQWPQRGRGTTKPGTLLKSQVPIRTFTEWDDARPGFLEIDLVDHGGGQVTGEHLFTLSTVDVSTGWVTCVGIRNKSEYAVLEAIGTVRQRLPVPLLGLDSDNGSEFLNRSLVRYCQTEGITFTRSRPYRKNDNCYVEQKNWSVVRRLVGYARFEAAGLPALDDVLTLADDYVNMLQPVLKLLEKTRDGAKVTKRYDRAKTPYQRLLEAEVLNPEQTQNLTERYTRLHPIRLKLAIEDAQRKLYEKAVRLDSPMRQR